MDLRSVTCPSCDRTIDEASVHWDRAATTGACPYCARFYDPSRESARIQTARHRASAQPYVSAEDWARLTVTCLVGAIVVELAALAAGVLAIYNLGRALQREPHLAVADLELELRATVGDWVASVPLARLAILAATAACFLAWVYRANSNLRALGAERQRFSSGWAVGWWFVPFANLLQPRRIIGELWVLSRPFERYRSQPLIGWWWATYLLSAFLGRLPGVPGRSPDVPETWMMNIASVLTIAAAVLAVIIVRRIQARQEEQHLSVAAENGDDAEGPCYHEP